MNKRDFFRIIRKKLNRFGDDVADDAVEFYEEIINEKIRETGISEEQAIADLGDPNKLAVEMASDLVAANKLKNPSRGMFWLLGSLALSPYYYPWQLPHLLCILSFFPSGDLLQLRLVGPQ